MYSLESNITIQRNTKFDGNTATSLTSTPSLGGKGGVLYSLESNITIQSGKFDDNSATSSIEGGKGGVLHFLGGTIKINASKFDGNSAISKGIGGSRCLQCPGYWLLQLTAITLAAMLASIALVAILLSLNMTVAVGSLNGLIFYVNVVYANKSILLPLEDTSLVAVLISLLNLEFGVDTCYFPGMDTYAKTWLQLAFPAYVIFLVGLVFLISSMQEW